jgi:hypothetical protein
MHGGAPFILIAALIVCSVERCGSSCPSFYSFGESPGQTFFPPSLRPVVIGFVLHHKRKLGRDFAAGAAAGKSWRLPSRNRWNHHGNGGQRGTRQTSNRDEPIPHFRIPPIGLFMFTNASHRSDYLTLPPRPAPAGSANSLLYSAVSDGTHSIA